MINPSLPLGLEFNQIENIDARRGFRRCSLPGVGTALKRGQTAITDFWWNKGDNVVVRFTSQDYVYCYKFSLKSGAKITYEYINDYFSEFIMNILLVWLIEGIDYPPLDYLN